MIAALFDSETRATREQLADIDDQLVRARKLQTQFDLLATEKSQADREFDQTGDPATANKITCLGMQIKRLASQMPKASDIGRLSGDRQILINRFLNAADETRLKVIDRYLQEMRNAMHIPGKRVDDARDALRHAEASKDKSRIAAAKESLAFVSGVAGLFADGVRLAEDERSKIFAARRKLLGI